MYLLNNNRQCLAKEKLNVPTQTLQSRQQNLTLHHARSLIM